MARQFSKPIDLYNAQKDRFDHVMVDVRAMHRELAEEGLKDWISLTSGGISSLTLKQLGHPFGRGGSAKLSTATGRMRGASKLRLQSAGIRGSVPPLPINRQTGRLQSSIRLQQVGTRPQTFAVGADAGVAGGSLWVLSKFGTRKMIARGFEQEVERRWKARNKALLDNIRQRQRGG